MKFRSDSKSLRCSCLYACAADNDEPTTLRTFSENQPSTPMLRVKTAKIATNTVGISATMANTALNRRCKREPAEWARRAAKTRMTENPIRAMITNR